MEDRHKRVETLFWTAHRVCICTLFEKWTDLAVNQEKNGGICEQAAAQ